MHPPVFLKYCLLNYSTIDNKYLVFNIIYMVLRSSFSPVCIYLGLQSSPDRVSQRQPLVFYGRSLTASPPPPHPAGNCPTRQQRGQQRRFQDRTPRSCHTEVHTLPPCRHKHDGQMGTQETRRGHRSNRKVPNCCACW